MTNFEKIKAMSVEEMAELLNEIHSTSEFYESKALKMCKECRKSKLNYDCSVCDRDLLSEWLQDEAD